MTDSWDGAAPTRDEDAVETDAHAASSAEELDEDRLRLDPLEAGMDPPERWSGVDKYGMTPYEQAHPRASPIGCRRKNPRCTTRRRTASPPTPSLDPNKQTRSPSDQPPVLRPMMPESMPRC
jgi:hypothetical protein